MEITESRNKKRAPLPLRFLRGILVFIATTLVLLIGWLCFSAFDRASPLEFLPEGYTAVIHTDSIFKSLEPLVDLKAADIVLAEPALAPFRGSLMEARSFFNNSNFLIRTMLSRSANAAIYTDENESGFVAVIDLSCLSAATRLSKIAAPFIKIENLSYDKENFFKYDAGAIQLYIKPIKNLAVISMSKPLFEQASPGGRIVSDEERRIVEGKKTKSIKIVANAKKVAELILPDEAALESILPHIKDNALTSVSLSLTNEDIDINMSLPLSVQNDNSALSKLLKEKSSVSNFLPHLTSEAHYYTLFNFNSIEDLKDAAFQIMQQKQDVNGMWRRASSICKTLFSLTLEEIIFSWTGRECAVIGIEGSSDLIFALQIADENRRREVFEKLGSSIILNSNTSLIVGGMRLPRFEFPPLVAALLKAFGVSLPSPYYLVKNGFVFFSMSPQNLSAIYSHDRDGYTIAKNENWKRVSEKSSALASIELYYNLNRSLPFFIDNASVSAKILRLYGIGRGSVSLDGNEAVIHLHASSVIEETTRQVEGFPIKADRSDFLLYPDSASAAKNIFWLENSKTLRALNLSTLEKKTYEFGYPSYISVLQDTKNNEGLVWAASENGNIYLLDRNLNCLDGFPIVTGETITAAGAPYDKGVVFPSAKGKLLLVKKSGERIQELASIQDANFRSPPATIDNFMAVYDRGFEGKIYLFENSSIKNRASPILIDGIGFSSPCVAKIDRKIYVAFITQSGTFYLFNASGDAVEGFPIQIDDVFYTNAVYLDKSFFVLSEKSMLYKISLDTNMLSVQLPDTPASREGIISTLDTKTAKSVFASGDNNVLYGFNSSLELISSFPVPGRGRPVLADINNDKKEECIVLSINRELNAWSKKQ